ncbi:MAG: type VI secretion system accessory protein TagJ [Acidobacteriota bacterium]|jgi:type VI secretion system protein ImpE|nr:type VI secretion system accessory protein TagJ [Acidobacteriota bacterium]
MNANDLYREGKIEDAIKLLSAELRNDPTDVRRRTFLFELLCFMGELDRAEKQLDILSDLSREAGMGTLIYRSALQAERLRREMFDKKTFPQTEAAPIERGILNGVEIGAIEDADPRIGPRLEVYAAGSYLWLPMAHITSIRMEAPRRVRDLIWIPAILKTGPQCGALDLGEVLVPALTPSAFRHADTSVRLGRQTVWEEVDGNATPAGQKLLLVDGEEFPILEVRTLEFPVASEAAGE